MFTSGLALSTTLGTTTTGMTLVDAPGSGWRYRIGSYVLQREGSSSTRVQLKSDTDAFAQIYCENAGDGMTEQFTGDFIQFTGEDEAINLALSSNTTVGYVVRYVKVKAESGE